MLTIECIKGFRLDGGSFPIMKGERFKLSEGSGIGEMVFEASVLSFNPGMEMEFTNDQLCNNFQLIVGR
jgi:hypothetical protein